MPQPRKASETAAVTEGLGPGPPAVPPPSASEIERERLLGLLRDFNPQLVASNLHEQELTDRAREQTAHWQSLLIRLAEGVIVASPDGRLLVANPSARAMLGLAAVGPLNQYPDWARLDFCSLEGRRLAPEERPLNRVLRGEQFANYEIQLVPPGGSPRRIVATGGATADETGQVQLALLVLRDVTELRCLEKVKEEYVSIISHDLRTPLAIISGRTEMIQRAAAKAGLGAIAQDAEIVLRNARLMDRMIQDLLETARLERGEAVLHRERVDLNEAIAAAVEASVPPAALPRIRIAFGEPGGIVLADPTRLERVIANLLTNALQYSPGESPIEIELRRNDGQVQVSVTDHGPGIPLPMLPHLFERFYRVEKAHPHDGLGLGLYSARLIVEALGGRIWVTSELGRGSTFTFSLPLA